MKALARLVFVAGAVGIGIFFFRAAPRDVTLVYGLAGSGARQLEVAIEKQGESVRRAEFRLGPERPASVSHRVRLTDGEYRIRVLVTTDAAPRLVERSIQVTESGTIVIPLGT
jgi:hypothetical protein